METVADTMTDKLYIDLMQGLKLTQGIHQWSTSDDLDTWKQNQKDPEKRALLKKLGWEKDSISYQCDNLGFRNKKDLEKDKKYTLFLGDSFTFGVGLAEHQVWTHHVSQYLNGPCYNAGQGGASIDSCYRYLRFFLNQSYKFENVFLFSPTKSRTELYDAFEKKWMTVAWWSHYSKDVIEKFTNKYFTQLNFEKTLNAIENQCIKNDIKFFHINTDDCDHFMLEDTTARDLQHAGPKSHDRIAKQFIKLYDNTL